MPLSSKIYVLPYPTITLLTCDPSRPGCIATGTLIPPRPIPTNATSLPPPSFDNPRSYLFHPRATTNVAVYFGQSAATTRTSLIDQCADPNIDMVILGFMTSTNADNGGWLRLELSAACPSYQTAQMVAVAPGLVYFPYLEEDITKCQTKYGKKVTLSLGGAGSVLPLSSDIEAIHFADKLFGLFGPRGYVDAGLRPFGEAVIDGFDLDKSDDQPARWGTFAAQLRARFASDPSKDYYLTAAPGCSSPDASIPLGYLVESNFVWPQFFNNPACEIGSDGFSDSLRQWSQALATGVAPLRNSSALRTHFYVGTPAWSAAGPSAYSGFGGRPRGVSTLAAQVKAYSNGNLGGIMFWDGPEGQENVQDGLSILGWAKRGLWGW